MKNRKIKAMTLSLNPTIQSLILHMYTIFEDSRLPVPEKTVTQIKSKRQKNGQIIEKSKSKESDSQSHNTTTHCSCVYQVSRF